MDTMFGEFVALFREADVSDILKTQSLLASNLRLKTAK
jgi:hypothetical protein